jgi:integrase
MLDSDTHWVNGVVVLMTGIVAGTVLGLRQHRARHFRRRHFDPAASAVGLARLVPHELRHTAASLAISAGASIKGVQAMLGHASATLTLDRYGHLFPNELDAVADRLDVAARAAAVPSPRPPTSLVEFAGSKTGR